MGAAARAGGEGEPPVRVRVLRSLVPGRDGRPRFLDYFQEPGLTLRAYLPRRVEAERVVLNGGVYRGDALDSVTAGPGDDVVVFPRFGVTAGAMIAIGVSASYAAAAAFVVNIAISIAVSIALSYAIQAVFPAPKPKMRSHDFGGDDSPTYGWSGITTVKGPGNVVPFVYGQHRLGGQLISSYIEPSDTTDQQFLNMLIALGEGVFDSVDTTTVEVNEQPVANFTEVTMDTRTGTDPQTAMANFQKSSNTIDVTSEITQTELFYTSADTLLNEFTANFLFPLGVFQIDDDGNRQTNGVTLKARYRLLPAGPWSFDEILTFTENRRSAMRRSWRITGLAAGQYEIGLTFVSATNANPDRAAFQVFLASVTETRDVTPTFNGTALLGLRALATERLNGEHPNITVVAKGRKVKVWDGAQFVVQWSDNPAWCLRDFLTAGLNVPEADVNDSSFVTFAAYCDTVVGGEKRCLLDYVIDKDADAASTLLELLAGTRASLLKTNGLWEVRVAQDEAPTQLVNWANVVRDSLRISYVRDIDRVNVLEAQFANKDLGYKQDVMTWPLVADWPATVFKSSINLPGVVRASQVQRELQFHLNSRKLVKESIEFRMSLEGMVFQAMDLFRFSHPLPGWGKSGRAGAGSTTSILVLDETVTLAPATTYHVYVRFADDTTALRTVTTVASDTSQLDLDSPLPQIPTLGTTLWALGKASPEGATKTFRAIKIERTGELEVAVAAIEHNAAIYTDPTAQPVPSPTNLFNPLAPSPPLTSLVAFEETRVGDDGVSRPVITVDWEVQSLAAAGAGFAPYGGADVYTSYVGAAGPFQLHGSTNGELVRSYTIPNPALGIQVWIRVYPHSTRGVPNNNGSLTTTVTPNGAVFTPPVVSGLRLVNSETGDPNDTNFTGRDAIFTWSAVTVNPTDDPATPGWIQDYMVEVTIGAVVVRRSFVAVPGFTYTYEMNSNDTAGSPARTFKLSVWARSRIGTISTVPASLTVSNPAPTMASILPTATALVAAALFNWSQYVPDADVERYDLYLQKGVNPPVSLWGARQAYQKDVAIWDLDIGDTYYFRVVPVDAFGGGTTSQTVSVVPIAFNSGDFDTVAPAVPTGLALSSAVVVGLDGGVNAQVVATWSANTESDFLLYRLRLRRSGDTAYVYMEVPDKATVTATFHGLVPNAAYLVSIQGQDQLGNRSAFSAEVSVTTGTNTSAPSQVAGLTLTPGFKVMGARWTAVSQADLEGYYVERSQTGAFTGEQVVRGPLQVTWVVDGELGVLVTYFYRVRARNTSGVYGAYSAAVSATTLAVGASDITASVALIDQLFATQALVNELIAQVNGVGTTTIKPGLVQVSGATTLADWRSGADQTKIEGGRIGANTIEANSLTIGQRGVQAAGIEFTNDRTAVVSWTAGIITYVNDARVATTASVVPGSATYPGSGVLYVYWPKGGTSLAATTSSATAYGTNNVIMATYRGGTDMTTDVGRTIIDGNQVKTGTLTADRVVAGTLTGREMSLTEKIITKVAQVEDAVIESAKVKSLDASKITSGQLIATLDMAPSAALRSAASGQRVEVTAAEGVRVFNASNQLVAAFQPHAPFCQIGVDDGNAIKLDGLGSLNKIITEQIAAGSITTAAFATGPSVTLSQGQRAQLTFGTADLDLRTSFDVVVILASCLKNVVSLTFSDQESNLFGPFDFPLGGQMELWRASPDGRLLRLCQTDNLIWIDFRTEGAGSKVKYYLVAQGAAPPLGYNFLANTAGGMTAVTRIEEPMLVAFRMSR